MITIFNKVVISPIIAILSAFTKLVSFKTIFIISSMNMSQLGLYIDELLRVIVGFSILVLAIFLQKTCYLSPKSRSVLLAAITCTTLWTYNSESAASSSLICLRTFFSIWINIWSASLLFVHHPPRDFLRIRRREKTDSVHCTKTIPRVHDYIWESYPAEISVRRLLWTLDVVFNFRGLGWNFPTGRYYFPIQNNRKDGLSLDKTGVDHMELKIEPELVICSLRRRFQRFYWAYICTTLCGYLMSLDP
jgi:hypothetical protein